MLLPNPGVLNRHFPSRKRNKLGSCGPVLINKRRLAKVLGGGRGHTGQVSTDVMTPLLPASPCPLHERWQPLKHCPIDPIGVVTVASSSKALPARARLFDPRRFLVQFLPVPLVGIAITVALSTTLDLVDNRTSIQFAINAVIVSGPLIWLAYWLMARPMSRAADAIGSADPKQIRKGIRIALHAPWHAVQVATGVWALGHICNVAAQYLVIGQPYETVDWIMLANGFVATTPIVFSTSFALVENHMRPVLRQLQHELPTDNRIKSFRRGTFSIMQRVCVVVGTLLLAAGIMIGTVAYTSTRDDLSNGQLIAELLPVMAMLTVFAAVMLFAIRQSIRGSVAEIVAEVEAVAAGDFSRRAAVTTIDELGQVMLKFDLMLTNQSELIRGTVGAAKDVASGAAAVHEGSEQSNRGVEQISTAMQDVVQGAQSQFNEVDNARKAADTLAAAMEKAAAAVSAASAAAERAKVLAGEGAEGAEAAQLAMVQIEQRIDEASRSVEALGRNTADIGSIVETISTIAKQTNLLALNAAIEAARAGEVGRGFAVVAEEVRQLATGSSEAAAEITELIGRIDAGAQTAIHAVRTGNDEVSRGATVVAEAGARFGEIAGSLGEIAGLVKDIDDSTALVQESTGAVTESVDSILVVTESVAALAEQTSANTQEASASSEEIASSAQALASTARTLESQVLAFKV